MRDKQIAPATTAPRIFILSAVLHCISMTALVYLRSSFGFGYLRPKSVFFAFSWALVLYSVYAWNEAAVWSEHRTVILFSLGAAILYWFHLAVAFIREWRESGEHEQFSGILLPAWLIQRMGGTSSEGLESTLRFWGEPAVALIGAIVLRWFVGERYLSRWLLISACSLWAKEALNNWFLLRQRKRQRDIFAETEDATLSNITGAGGEPPQAARKAKVKRTRNEPV